MGKQFSRKRHRFGTRLLADLQKILQKQLQQFSLTPAGSSIQPINSDAAANNPLNLVPSPAEATDNLAASSNLPISQPPSSRPPQSTLARQLPLRLLLWLPSFIAVGAGIWVASVPPAPDCRQLSFLASDGNRLYCANQAARSGNVPALVDALKLVSNWSKDHPLYNQASNLAEEWSVSLLLVARNEADRGNFQRAKELAQLVPKATSVHEEAQNLYAFWDNSGDEGKTLFRTAQSALKQLDWPRARANVKMLMSLGSSQWQAQAQKLMETIAVEETAWDQLVRAEDYASYQTPNELVEAIQIVRTLTRGTAAFQEAQEKLKKWNQKLLEFALARQQAGDMAGAIELFSKVAPDSAQAAGVQDLMQLGKAQDAAKKDNLWGYLQAVAMLQQIPRENAVSSLVQTQRQTWERQVRDLAQLQVVNALASQQNLIGYQLAIAQANLITPDQPPALRSKELTGRLQQRIQQIEDQPYLAAAIALGEKRQYRQAMQTAQLISSERPLYNKAQDKIWGWRGELEAVFDRPILDRAMSLANMGEFTQAMSVASQIERNRVMYGEAQRQIDIWRSRLAAIEAARRPRVVEPEAPPEPNYAPEPEAPPAEPEGSYYPRPRYYPPAEPDPGATPPAAPNPEQTAPPPAPVPTAPPVEQPTEPTLPPPAAESPAVPVVPSPTSPRP